MRAELEERLEELARELGADALAVRQQVGAHQGAVVLLSAPPGGLPAGLPWPANDDAFEERGVQRDAARLAGLVPPSIRLALGRPPRAALVAPVPGTRCGVIALWTGDAQPPASARARLDVSIAALAAKIGRWEAHDQLLLEGRRHEAALATLEDAVVTLDPSRERASLNASAARLFGLPPGEVATTEVTHALMRLQQRALNPGEVRAVLLRLLTEPGAIITDAIWSFPSAPRHLRVSSRPLEAPGLSGRSWVFSDVSRLVDALQEAERVERLKGEFIATVSHELRTPLTSIRGALGLLAGGITGELPALAKEHVELALKNAERLIRLVNDLLDVERLQSGSLQLKLQRAALAPLVEHAVQANQGYAAALRVELSLARPLPDGEVLVDADRLEQVLTNLISNAAKFSPAGRPVEIAAAARDGRVRITVRDHGPGVPAEFTARIFERFAQADGSDRKQRGGSGLGLSISRGLIERMGGTIGFDTPPGGGARFFVELPLAP